MNIDDIKDIKIEYRDKLDINPNTTIGIEIEFQKAFVNLINMKLKRKVDTDWIAKYDATVSSCAMMVLYGGEINSPILRNNEKSWEELKTVCEILDKKNAQITEKCGGHIHIGEQILNHESYMEFIKLWYLYEPIIYRFCYGEFNRERKLMNTFASSLRNLFLTVITNEKYFESSIDLINYLSKERRQAVNFQNVLIDKKTIEFRCPNSSLNPVIWQNNVNFFAHLLDKSNNVEIDEDKLNYTLRYHTKNFRNCLDYIKINMNEAIELANIIFDNEIDKLYFLRQYVKDGVCEKREINFTKAIRFTK